MHTSVVMVLYQSFTAFPYFLYCISTSTIPRSLKLFTTFVIMNKTFVSRTIIRYAILWKIDILVTRTTSFRRTNQRINRYLYKSRFVLLFWDALSFFIIVLYKHVLLQVVVPGYLYDYDECKSTTSYSAAFSVNRRNKWKECSHGHPKDPIRPIYKYLGMLWSHSQLHLK